MEFTRDQVLSLVQRDKESFLSDYKRLVESPSISALQAHKKDIRQTAAIASALIKKAGGTAEVIETRGNPVVWGRIGNDPNLPTVAIYNHLDVQPATEGEDGWIMNPFTFREEDGRFYSRGTTDDKGPAMTALWGTAIAKELGVQMNVEFIWELEEEIGSPNFEEFILKTKDKMKAKCVIVSDTIWLADGAPSITQSLRGMLTALVRIRTSKKNTHSGMTGGPARNPVLECADIASKCVDAKTGEILIPGFRSTWKPPKKELVDQLVASGFSVDYFKTAHGLEKLRTEDPSEVLTKIWMSPTFEVHGIKGGYQGEGIKSAVPPHAELKVSFRLVPGQDPKEIFSLFEKHAKSIVPDCEVIKDSTLPPYKAPDHVKEIASIQSALQFAFGREAVPVMEGGSIGAVLTMANHLDVPILFMGLSLPEDSYHGPNESFAWKQMEGGVVAFAKLLSNLSTS